MLRDEMIALVSDFAMPAGPLRGMEEQFAARDAGIAAITPGELGEMLALADDPPARIAEGPWEAALLDCLAEWGRLQPEQNGGALARAADDSPGGLLALEALAAIGASDAPRVLMPLAARAASLSVRGQIALVDAMAATGLAGHELLEILENSLAGAPPEVQGALQAARTPGGAPTRRDLWTLATNAPATIVWDGQANESDKAGPT